MYTEKAGQHYKNHYQIIQPKKKFKGTAGLLTPHLHLSRKGRENKKSMCLPLNGREPAPELDSGIEVRVIVSFLSFRSPDYNRTKNLMAGRI